MHASHHDLAVDLHLLFAGLWPRRQTDDEITVWVEQFAHALHGLPLVACWEAASEWADTQTRWPSPVDLVREARRLARDMDPGPPEPENPSAHQSFAKAHIAAMRQITARSSDLFDRHDHRHGAEQCPVCAQPDRVIAEILDNLPKPTVERLSRCRSCDGSGICESDSGAFPCPTCNADGHFRWEDGYRPRWTEGAA